MTETSGLHAAFATVRQTNAAHVSALDALERAFTAETALFLWPRLFPSIIDQMMNRGLRGRVSLHSK